MAKRWAGWQVTQARNYWRSRVEAGIKCSKCKKPIGKGQKWHVDHLVPRELGGQALGLAYTWPAHDHCNTSDGGKRGAEITNAKKRAKKMNTNNTEPLNAQAKRDMGIRGV